ncbi:MAG: hypothetical protein IM584_10300, partial [Chitinophagaceae bacterium]|nr:hypothetical protein [Chitinophagaceae bacterium]
MKKMVSLLLTCLLLACITGLGQRITYSEPDRDDPRMLNFEVLGRINGKILVYKSYRDLHYIVTYDSDMKMLEKKKLDFINYRVLNTEFIPYSDFVYMIYQFQKRSIMYCMAIKLDGTGTPVGDPVQLDS